MYHEFKREGIIDSPDIERIIKDIMTNFMPINLKNLS